MVIKLVAAFESSGSRTGYEDIFKIIKEWCQLPPTFNITPDLTRLILVNSGRVYGDCKEKVLAEDFLQVATLKHCKNSKY